MINCTERFLNSDMGFAGKIQEKATVCGAQPSKEQPAALPKCSEFPSEME